MKSSKYTMIRKWTGRITATAGLLLLTCFRAEAHLVSTGLGPVYDGIVHMVLSPADMTIVIVLAILAAMRGSHSGRWLLALLPVAWLLGGISGLIFPVTAGFGWITGLSFLVPGALVAADRDLPMKFVIALTSLIGVVHGFLTGAAMASSPSAGLELTGELVVLIVVITLVSGIVVSLKAFWMRIVVRVLGSWIAATGLLIIGWSLRAVN